MTVGPATGAPVTRFWNDFATILDNFCFTVYQNLKVVFGFTVHIHQVILVSCIDRCSANMTEWALPGASDPKSWHFFTCSAFFTTYCSVYSSSSFLIQSPKSQNTPHTFVLLSLHLKFTLTRFNSTRTNTYKHMHGYCCKNIP